MYGLLLQLAASFGSKRAAGAVAARVVAKQAAVRARRQFGGAVARGPGLASRGLGAGGRAASATVRGVTQVGSGVAALTLATAAQDHLGFKELAKWIPSFFHSITVEVTGGPGADLRRCWYLALATCFGRYRRGLKGVSGRTIAAQWDITGKKVSITMAYTFAGAVDGFLRSALNSTSRTGLNMLHEGPDQVTIGGGWPTFFFTKDVRKTDFFTGPTDGLKEPTSYYAFWHRDFYTSDEKLATERRTIVLPLEPPEYRYADVLDPKDAAFSTWFISYERYMSRAKVPILFGALFKPDVLREYPYGIGESNSSVQFLIRNLSPSGTVQGFHQYDRVGVGGGSVPRLDDDGRLITTGEKHDPLVQNPRPPVDGLAKGSILRMIAQTLSHPGYLVDPPPVGNCGAAPIGYKGLKIWPAGTPVGGVNGTTARIARIMRREETADGRLPVYSGATPSSPRSVIFPGPTENIR